MGGSWVVMDVVEDWGGESRAKQQKKVSVGVPRR